MRLNPCPQGVYNAQRKTNPSSLAEQRSDKREERSDKLILPLYSAIH
jgi:hypothetical protein